MEESSETEEIKAKLLNPGAVLENVAKFTPEIPISVPPVRGAFEGLLDDRMAASKENNPAEVPSTPLTVTVVCFSQAPAPKSPAATHATVVLELQAPERHAALSEAVCVESPEPKFSPWRATVNEPVNGPLGPEMAVSTGASYVKASIFVPTELKVTVMALCAPLPKGIWHRKAVFVVHAAERQTLMPNCTVGNLSDVPNEMPSSVSIDGGLQPALTDATSPLSGRENDSTGASKLREAVQVAATPPTVTCKADVAAKPLSAVLHCKAVAVSHAVVEHASGPTATVELRSSTAKLMPLAVSRPCPLDGRLTRGNAEEMTEASYDSIFRRVETLGPTVNETTWPTP
jgi:hypothetical protein